MAVEASWEDPDKLLIPVILGSAEVPSFLQDRVALRVKSERDWKGVAREISRAVRSRSDVPRAVPSAHPVAAIPGEGLVNAIRFSPDGTASWALVVIRFKYGTL